MMTVTFYANGKHRTTAQGATIADFLKELQLAATQVVVEYNGEPLGRELFDRTRLEAGDRVEIAQVVGGG